MPRLCCEVSIGGSAQVVPRSATVATTHITTCHIFALGRFRLFAENAHAFAFFFRTLFGEPVFYTSSVRVISPGRLLHFLVLRGRFYCEMGAVGNGGVPGVALGCKEDTLAANQSISALLGKKPELPDRRLLRE